MNIINSSSSSNIIVPLLSALLASPLLYVALSTCPKPTAPRFIPSAGDVTCAARSSVLPHAILLNRAAFSPRPQRASSACLGRIPTTWSPPGRALPATLNATPWRCREGLGSAEQGGDVSRQGVVRGHCLLAARGKER